MKTGIHDEYVFYQKMRLLRANNSVTLIISKALLQELCVSYSAAAIAAAAAARAKRHKCRISQISHLLSSSIGVPTNLQESAAGRRQQRSRKLAAKYIYLPDACSVTGPIQVGVR